MSKKPIDEPEQDGFVRSFLAGNSRTDENQFEHGANSVRRRTRQEPRVGRLAKEEPRVAVATDEQPDLDNSIRFDMSDMLPAKFDGPVATLAQEVIEHSKLKKVGDATKRQIQTTISAIAANLIRAYTRDQKMFVGISLGPQYYTASRYNCQGIGFENVRRTIKYMDARVPKLITLHLAPKSDAKNRKSSRIRLTPAFLDYFGVKHPSIFDVAENPKFECIRLKDDDKKPVKYDDSRPGKYPGKF